MPDGVRGSRSIGTAIYYLITPSDFSALHRLPGTEVFHFYCGDPVVQLQLLPDGSSQTVYLGSRFVSGQRPQVVVRGHVWQGSRLVPGGSWALMGTTMSPGFDFADYETRRSRATDLRSTPELPTEIKEYTR